MVIANSIYTNIPDSLHRKIYNLGFIGMNHRRSKSKPDTLVDRAALLGGSGIFNPLKIAPIQMLPVAEDPKEKKKQFKKEKGVVLPGLSPVFVTEQKPRGQIRKVEKKNESAKEAPAKLKDFFSNRAIK